MATLSLDWKQLLTPRRRKDDAESPLKFDGVRTEHERDYDRILFCAPVRRLADKTQVFPLDQDDSVHTRLTHSHEVSNLARSIGVNLAFNHTFFPNDIVAQRNVPAALAAAGLAHDLGNPPFGHQGETSIQDWFEKERGQGIREGLRPQRGHATGFPPFRGQRANTPLAHAATDLERRLRLERELRHLGDADEVHRRRILSLQS
jgi:dGTPase